MYGWTSKKITERGSVMYSSGLVPEPDRMSKDIRVTDLFTTRESVTTHYKQLFTDLRTYSH